MRLTVTFPYRARICGQERPIHYRICSDDQSVGQRQLAARGHHAIRVDVEVALLLILADECDRGPPGRDLDRRIT